MTVQLYGIPNCDSVKKMRAALTADGWGVAFHDFKKSGVPMERVTVWISQLGWERLINRQGTTWKQLGPDRQAAVVDAASAMALMREQPSVIKRPVIEWPDGQVTVGVVPLRSRDAT